jgi:hypothetical protein
MLGACSLWRLRESKRASIEAPAEHRQVQTPAFPRANTKSGCRKWRASVMEDSPHVPGIPAFNFASKGLSRI